MPPHSAKSTTSTALGMARNGATSPPISPPVPTSPTLGQASQVLNDLRLSVDSERSNPSSPPIHTNGVNGHAQKGGSEDDDESDPVSRLQRELERTREEKEALATQYRNLLAKLTTMRTTLGNKLRQDAVSYAQPLLFTTGFNGQYLHRKSLTDENSWFSNSLPKMMIYLRRSTL